MLEACAKTSVPVVVTLKAPSPSEPLTPLIEGQRPQILAALFENIVEPDPGRIIGDHLRRRDLAVEPLLQIVERRDLAVAYHQRYFSAFAVGLKGNINS